MEVLVAAEQARAAGLDELVAIVEGGPVGLRGRALRGLGRSGEEAARSTLEAALAGPGDRAEVARAYGLLGEVGRAAPLAAAFSGADTATQRALLDALSRVAVAADRELVIPLIVPLTSGPSGEDPEVAEAAALALGRLGRRGIELDPVASSSLVVASTRSEAAVRYAATYALARGATPTPEVIAALRQRLGDAEGETRGEALYGIAKLWAAAPGAAQERAKEGAKEDPPAVIDGATEQEIADEIAGLLQDPEWLVVLGAIRAATGEGAPPSLRAPVIARLARGWSTLLESEAVGPEIHLLESGIERLRPVAAEAEVRALAERLVAESSARLAEGGAPSGSGIGVALSRTHCQALALAIRGGAADSGLRSCGGPQTRGSAPHLRRSLLAEVAGEGLVGGIETLEELAGDGDARVRLAAQIAAGELAKGTKRTKKGPARATDEERRRASNLLLAGLRDPSSAVAGASAGLLGELLSAEPSLPGLDRPGILRGLVGSLAAGGGGDPELEAAVLGAIVIALGGAEGGEGAGDAAGEGAGGAEGEGAGDAAGEGAEAAKRERGRSRAVEAEPSLSDAERATLVERCGRDLAGPAPVRSAAERCLKALGEAIPSPSAPATARGGEEPEYGDEAAEEGSAEALGGAEAAPSSAHAVVRPPFDPRLLAPAAKIRWTLDTTRGAITIALDPTVAPWNTAALVGLAGQAFYGGVSWHRVVPGFVVQGGDPSGTGWGGPGFSSPGEPSWRSFDRGAVGIADAGRDTGGSQFFIMQARAPHLEGRYTWVGEVTDGMDVVDRLTTDDRVLSTIVDAPPRFEAVVRSP